MARDNITNTLFAITAALIITGALSGCAALLNKYKVNMNCPSCEEKMVHIIKKDKAGKISCKTCGSEMSKSDKQEHYCANCGARIENFTMRVPF